MSSGARALRRLAQTVVKTPLHPQWLLNDEAATVDWIRSTARGRVLDIGCADRWIEPHLPRGCNYIGLDYPPTGRDLYASHPDVFADAARLPLIDEAVDTVIFLEVLEHLRDSSKALKEVARVLRPGGTILLSVPFLYPIHDAPHDYQRLTRHGLYRDVESAGLHVESIRTRLGAAESAGLVACLALAGIALQAVQQRRPGVVLVPLLLVAIPAINLLARICGRLLPTWDAMTNGYQLIASKP